MSIRIITDSGCDILPEEAQRWNIEVLPLTICFGSESYADGVTITREDFYRRMADTGVIPTTSQITPYAYEERFHAAREAGDEVVCITLSSKLSGCHQSARIAADGAPDIHLVDSETVCIGQRILIQRAMELRKLGCSGGEIARILEVEKKSIRLIALLDTLEYLKKGGRISPAAALAGSLLGIKPVNAIENGQVAVLGKARGSKNGNNLLTSFIEKSGGIDFSRPYALAYSGLSDALLQAYIKDSTALYAAETDNLPISGIGSAIGTHAGPGAIAAAFFAGKKG